MLRIAEAIVMVRTTSLPSSALLAAVCRRRCRRRRHRPTGDVSGLWRWSLSAPYQESTHNSAVADVRDVLIVRDSRPDSEPDNRNSETTYMSNRKSSGVRLQGHRLCF